MNIKTFWFEVKAILKGEVYRKAKNEFNILLKKPE